jgi:RNA polymerase sigma-70 factor (ECF subfamily)
MSGDVAAVPLSDEELARQAQEGCVASFTELVRRFQVPLLQFLRRWCTHEDAEDLVQDTLVRAYHNLDRYRSSWRFATWLFTIARRLSMNLKRRPRAKLDPDTLETVEDSASGPDRLAADRESRGRLWELAAEALTEPQLTATWLYYVEDMPVAQIARVLGRSKTATKVTLFRARKRLMPIFEQLEPNGSAKDRDTPNHTTRRQTTVESNHG